MVVTAHRRRPKAPLRGAFASYRAPERCALKRRRRNALETTEMLEKTIARLAITGLSSPIAASGIAATL